MCNNKRAATQSRKMPRVGKGKSVYSPLFNSDKVKNINSVSELKQKKCSRCKQTMHVSNFYKKTKNTDGLQSFCKQCSNKAVLKTYHSESSKVKEGL